MLTRLYIDNYRCFVNFEFRPAGRQLILGGNGSGKSSFMDALGFLRQIVVEGTKIADTYDPDQLTRWLDRSAQTFELETKLGDFQYRYRLVLDRSKNALVPGVGSEAVTLNGESLLETLGAQVCFRGGPSRGDLVYERDPDRSALAMAPFRAFPNLFGLKRWLGEMRCFRINPFSMESRSDREAPSPDYDLSNLAAWYRHLVQSSPKETRAFLDSLSAAIDGFSHLRFESVGERVSLLQAEFRGGARFSFKELSDGQRCLIALYMILHFVVAKGGTVVIDEPENFISLREIQPWLTAVTDAVEDGHGQVLLISHHPEIIDQWAPENGVQFVRDEAGPVRVEEFHGNPNSALSASELVARGWERE
jgi:predicted ATPase